MVTLNIFIFSSIRNSFLCGDSKILYKYIFNDDKHQQSKWIEVKRNLGTWKI